MVHITDAHGMIVAEREFHLTVSGGIVRFRGVFRTGRHGPTVRVRLDEFQGAIVGAVEVRLDDVREHLVRRRTVTISPRGHETSFWIEGTGKNGFQVLCRTELVREALARETGGR